MADAEKSSDKTLGVNNIHAVETKSSGAGRDGKDEVPLLKVPLAVPQSTAIQKTPGLCTATAKWKSKISTTGEPILDKDGNYINTPMMTPGEAAPLVDKEGTTKPSSPHHLNGSANNTVRPSIAITEAPEQAGSRPTSRLSVRASCSSLSLLATESGKLLQAVPLATGGPSDQHSEIVTLTINNHPLLAAVPYMPIPLAYVCLLLNIVIPGLGTLIAGFSVYCGAVPQAHTKKDELINCVFTNVCVAVSQLFTVTFLLVGWIWSVTWGVFMVLFAIEYRNFRRNEKSIATAKAVTKAFMGRC